MELSARCHDHCNVSCAMKQCLSFSSVFICWNTRGSMKQKLSKEKDKHAVLHILHGGVISIHPKKRSKRHK